VEKVSDNIVDGLDYDTVLEFDYLQRVFFESLRKEPPAGTINAQYAT
jgi:hypothetical protein